MKKYTTITIILISIVLIVGLGLGIPILKEKLKPTQTKEPVVESTIDTTISDSPYGEIVEEVVNVPYYYPDGSELRNLDMEQPVELGEYEPLEYEPVYHSVAKGQTLYSIAMTYNTTVSKLMAWNNLTNDRLVVGQQLIIGDHSLNGSYVQSLKDEIDYLTTLVQNQYMLIEVLTDENNNKVGVIRDTVTITQTDTVYIVDPRSSFSVNMDGWVLVDVNAVTPDSTHVDVTIKDSYVVELEEVEVEGKREPEIWLTIKSKNPYIEREDYKVQLSGVKKKRRE